MTAVTLGEPGARLHCLQIGTKQAVFRKSNKKQQRAHLTFNTIYILHSTIIFYKARIYSKPNTIEYIIYSSELEL